MAPSVRHRNYSWRRVGILVTCSIFFLGIYLIPTAWCQPPEEPVDPMPLRRVPLQIDRLPAEMEKVQQGILVEMPRRTFEEKVRLAAKSKNGRKNDPQLVEARYRARLEDSALTGTGQWKILYSGTRPAVLPLESLNLAIRQPRFENREALVGDFEGIGLGLLVEDAGARSVSLDWTARGEQGPAGLRFKLETPPSAVATLELDTPSDQVVNEEVGDCQVSGPFPSDSPNRRLWKISFADRPKLYLTVRKLEGPGQPAPLIVVDQMTEQRISPETVLSEFRFNLTVLHQGVTNLQFICDSTLAPYKVVAPKLEKWDLLPAPTADATSLLTIHLREPLRDGSIKVYCRSPIGQISKSKGEQTQGSLWRSPFLHLAGSISIGETLKFFLHPDIAFEDWHANGFTLIESKSDTTQDRYWPHVLTLKGSEPFDHDQDKNNKPENLLRPSAWIPRQRAEFGARTVMWWQESLSRSELLIQADYEVIKGKLFRLPLLLPSGWDVDRVKTSPPTLLRDWSIRTENGRSVLDVTLQRSLTAGATSTSSPLVSQNTARLTVSMKPSEKPGARGVLSEKGRVIPFPEIDVPEGRWQDRALAIDWDDQATQGLAKTSVLAASAPKDGPWGLKPPNAYFVFGEDNLTGTLELLPNAPKFAARIDSNVVFKNGRVSVPGSINVSVERGLLKELFVAASVPLIGSHVNFTTEKSAEKLSWEPFYSRTISPYLALLGMTQPVSESLNLAGIAQEHWWRLVLPKPLLAHEQVTLHFFIEVNQPSERSQWDIPLLTAAGAASNECTVAVQTPTAKSIEIQTKGLTEIVHAKGTPISSVTRWPSHTFAYQSSAARMSVLGQIPLEPQVSKPPIFAATLISSVSRDSLAHQFRFQVRNWKQPTLP
ncbi:MAG TPA: hypothetical protein VGZ25_02055, partial [Gemmataceae bacterium]|nr:hypothetical protein [Gemmataceae bacterium]